MAQFRAQKRPEWRPELSLGVVGCHLATVPSPSPTAPSTSKTSLHLHLLIRLGPLGQLRSLIGGVGRFLVDVSTLV